MVHVAGIGPAEECIVDPLSLIFFIVGIVLGVILRRWLKHRLAKRANPHAIEMTDEEYKKFLGGAVRAGVLSGADAADLYTLRTMTGNNVEDLDPKAFNKAWQENKQHLDRWDEAFEDALGGLRLGPGIPEGGVRQIRHFIPVAEVRELVDEITAYGEWQRNCGWNDRVGELMSQYRSSWRENKDNGYDALAETDLRIVEMYRKELRQTKPAKPAEVFDRISTEVMLPPEPLNIETKVGVIELGRESASKYHINGGNAYSCPDGERLPGLPAGWGWAPVGDIGQNLWQTFKDTKKESIWA